jgi:hypothetical protein
MKTRVIALSAVAGLASIASAQTPSFQYSIQAPAQLAPGASGTVTVLVGFTPGVGGAVTGGAVLGLSSGAFGITGNSGSWSANVGIAPYNFLAGVATNPGTPAGSNVNGVIWGNGFGPPLGTVSTVNPTPVWSATFTAGATNAVINVVPSGAHGVWYMPTGGTISSELTSTAVQGASATILVPAPASLALLGLGGLVAARRRR